MFSFHPFNKHQSARKLRNCIK